MARAGRPTFIRQVARQRLALVALAAGLLLTATASLAFAGNVARDRQAELGGLAVQARTAIERRVASYAEPLYGMSAVLGGPQPADRAAFHRYVDLAGTGRRQPGLLAYTFNRRVPAGEVAAFEASVRSDDSLEPGGNAGFDVHPDAEAGADRVVIELVEPWAGNEMILGYDVASDPERRAAVEAARDSGRLVATTPVRLMQEDGNTGFLLNFPVYRTVGVPGTAPARRRHFVGVVTAAVSLDQMLTGVAGGAPAAPTARIRIRITDVGATLDPRSNAEPEGVLVFDSATSGATAAGGGRASAAVADLNVGGRRWRLVATPERPLGSGQVAQLPWVAGIGGGVLSVVLACLLASLSGSKLRAVALAAGMTTNLRRQEDELRRANRHMAESNAALAAADRAKDAFLGTMSHELRTPLTAIAGFARLLDGRWDGLDADERRESLTQIIRSAGTLGNLVDDLLEFNRTGDQAPALVLEPVDIARAVREAVEVLRPLTATHHINLDTADATALADPIALSRILTNLVTNAVKFSPEGTTVTVATRALGDDAVLEVGDQGPGIPADQRDVVFERFYRAEDKARPRRPGTGIGLAVVKDLAERQGGSVRILDGAGGGAVFRVELPMAPGPVAASLGREATHQEDFV